MSHLGEEFIEHEQRREHFDLEEIKTHRKRAYAPPAASSN
jgi:hypothetical protein